MIILTTTQCKLQLVVVVVVVVAFLCGGDDCMLWWLYVVVVAVHGGYSHPSVAVVVLLYDCTLVGSGKRPPAQVTEGQDHMCK